MSLPLFQARRLLVFAPHPDDECLGCGGAIALAVLAGACVRVILVSDGSGAGQLPEGTAEVRQQEFRQALLVLGVSDWVVLGYPDGGLSGQASLADAVRHHVQAFEPDWVMGPAVDDLHADHRAVAKAVRQACLSKSTVDWVCEYESWGPVPITHVLDIGPVLDCKLQALSAHATALKYGNYLEASRGQAAYRGLLLGAEGNAAEAYACWRPRMESPATADSHSLELAMLRARERQLLLMQSQLAQQCNDMQASLSWRLTAPLRALRAAIPRQPRQAPRTRLHHLNWLPSCARQRLKAWLASSRLGARLLAGFPSSIPSGVTAVDKEAVRAAAEEHLQQFLQEKRILTVPACAGKPQVTVIVVLFNQAGLSLLCLQALLATRNVSYELILVDNGSSDRVPELLERVSGATILRPGQNLGFLKAVNLAAASARGEHLLLLNNDALVQEDALLHGVRRLTLDPGIGAVGGQILWWDGRLQEAGSIIWRDGSCTGYGRGCSPDGGPYRFVRDVDYCSGALLMVRRHLFEALGGFDEVFAPAYYEETDLCARLWQSGHRVVFDPAFRARHFEFASQTREGEALALQTHNRAVFVSKHGAFLAAQSIPARGAEWSARQRLRQGQLRTLVIDDRVPLPSLGRGYPRQCSVIQALVRCGAAVTMYPLLFPQESWEETYKALPEEVEVMQGLGLAGLHGFLDARGESFDVVLVSRPHNMEVMRRLKRRYPAWLSSAFWIYDAEALFSEREALKAEVLQGPLSAAAKRRLLQAEIGLVQGVDAVLAVSTREAQRLREAVNAPVHVLGHTITAAMTTTRFNDRAGFLFVGAMESDDSPNTDSVLWFLREVWPSVRSALGPLAHLDVVGPCDSISVSAHADPDVKVWGRVASLNAFYERARVFIAPTRFAAGIPHKAHEAAAAGLPMVVSDLIASQLGWDDDCLARAGDARAFAQACIDLHLDEQRWSVFRQRARAAVEQDCSPQTFLNTVQDLLESAKVNRQAVSRLNASVRSSLVNPT
jgi:GT2 family glycosyltransferase/LmbE family N-acetylglucosaminyl deacetylase/glycosyltransferase involved in cell wall biosynthesis